MAMWQTIDDAARALGLSEYGVGLGVELTQGDSIMCGGTARIVAATVERGAARPGWMAIAAWRMYITIAPDGSATAIADGMGRTIIVGQADLPLLIRALLRADDPFLACDAETIAVLLRLAEEVER